MHQHFLPNGEELTIRQGQEQDAAALLVMFRQAVRETDFLLTSPEEVNSMTVTQEREFIRSFIRNPNSLLLLSFIRTGTVGILSVAQPRPGKQAHVGELGITILKPYWNLGIGRRMMQTMLNWAQQHPVIRVIQLGVFAGNVKAIKLYSLFGFREKGRLERMIRQPDGTYQDLIYMTRWVKELTSGDSDHN
jgi:RimJ/RimL family protein N-acetyltransferase